MKRFIRDVLFTMLFIALADYLYGAFVKNNYSVKYAYITHHSNAIKTLVMGNSLAETGFNTSILGDSAWCFAISGRTLNYDSELLKCLLPTMQNLRTIILPLHYNLHASVLLYPNLEDRKFHIYYNYRYFHVPVNAFPDGWLYRSALLSNQLHRKNNGEVSFDKHGNMLVDKYYDGSVQDYNPPHQMNVDKGVEYLTIMAKTCAEYGIRFIVITPPFPDTWLKGCTEEGIKNLTMIADSVNQLFPLEYKSYLQDSTFRNDSLYSNWNHLNKYGATLFARQVKEDFGL